MKGSSGGRVRGSGRTERIAGAVLLALTAAGCRPAAGPAAPTPVSAAETPTLNNGCVAEFLFLNECGGRAEELVAWNAGEDFPSLGIGHLIWYPSGREAGPFKEMFPQFLAFARKKAIAPPRWVIELPDGKAPWKDREAFAADRGSVRVLELRDWLLSTRTAQADFIIERTGGLLPRLLQGASPESRTQVAHAFDLLMSTERGRIAVVDYVNFKGEGLLTSERYRGQGWGLLQVLQTMDVADGPSAAAKAPGRFADAAVRVLERRVENSPAERGEARWLPGWKNRVRRYPDWTCGDA